MTETFRSGYVAIVGWPNVGKSSLLNAFLGTKLSIVTPKPQTTRESILGIVNEPGVQMVFVDTPGWLKPQDTLQAFMRRSILQSLHDDADIIVWVVEPRPLDEEGKEFAGKLIQSGKPFSVVINKADTVDVAAIEQVRVSIHEVFVNKPPVVAISARRGTGVLELRESLKTQLPIGSPYFPTDQITDRWERFFVAEIVREKIFERYHQEVPHAAAVVVEEFHEQAGKKDVIEVTVFVETEGQKRILIGDKGRSVRDLGIDARKDIEAQLGRPVFLKIDVKIKKNWRKDEGFIKSIR